MRPLSPARPVERPAQEVELGVAADHRQVETAALSPRLGIDTFEPPGGDRLPLALRVDRRHLLAAGGVPDERPGRLADEHLSRLGRLLEAGCDVDRVADHEGFTLRRIAGEHVAGVDPDPGLDLAHLPDRVAHLEGRPQRPQRVVLVHRRDAEHCHEGVADHLLDRPAVALDRRAHRRVEPGHDAAHHLRIRPLGERCRADDVAEEDGDRLSHLAGRRRARGERRPAQVAEPRPVRVSLPAFSALGHGSSLRPPPGHGC